MIGEADATEYAQWRPVRRGIVIILVIAGLYLFGSWIITTG